jgi:hypothetical protein
VKVLHVDTEEGTDSIQDLIDAGQVVSVDGSTCEKFEQAYWDVRYGKIPGIGPNDLVVVDTLSTIAAEVIRQCSIDFRRVNPVAGKSIWAMSESAKVNWDRAYTFLKTMVVSYRMLPNPTIFLVHETLRLDPTSENVEKDPKEDKRHLMALTPKITELVMGLSDLTLRIYKSPHPFTENGAKYPWGTRVLQFENTPDSYTGQRLVVGQEVPSTIAEPTLEKVARAIGRLPRKITIYGYPKTGKTVLACTLPKPASAAVPAA